MNRSGKLHALLSTARVANIPSVVSNVWLGVAIGIALNATNLDHPDIPWCSVSRLIMAAICLYVAGNFLNDWMDRDWDAVHRPERALPRGLFTKVNYLGVAGGLAVAGTILALCVNGPTGLVALVIVTSIMIYTVWHKCGAWTVVPMGLCRGLLPVMGAFGMIGDIGYSDDFLITLLATLIAGGALFSYIVGLSMSARRESMAQPPKHPKISGSLFFVITGLVSLVPFKLGAQTSWIWFLAPIPYITWLVACHTIYRRPISRYVSALLAGIPLVDWIMLISFSLWELTLNPPRLPSHPLELVSLIIPPLAFISALLLQRLAPAT